MMSCSEQSEGSKTKRLKTATLTIGCCDSVLSLYLGPIVKIASKLRLTTDVTLQDLLQELDTVSYWFLFCAALDVLLLYGAQKRRKNFMLPYLTVNGLGILAVVVLNIQLFVQQATRDAPNIYVDLYFALSSFLSLGALFFTWLVCVNYFKQIHNKVLPDDAKPTES